MWFFFYKRWITFPSKEYNEMEFAAQHLVINQNGALTNSRYSNLVCEPCLLWPPHWMLTLLCTSLWVKWNKCTYATWLPFLLLLLSASCVKMTHRSCISQLGVYMYTRKNADIPSIKCSSAVLICTTVQHIHAHQHYFHNVMNPEINMTTLQGNATDSSFCSQLHQCTITVTVAHTHPQLDLALYARSLNKRGAGPWKKKKKKKKQTNSYLLISSKVSSAVFTSFYTCFSLCLCTHTHTIGTSVDLKFGYIWRMDFNAGIRTTDYPYPASSAKTTPCLIAKMSALTYGMAAKPIKGKLQTILSCKASLWFLRMTCLTLLTSI